MALLSRPAKGNSLLYRFAVQRFKHTFVQDWTPPETSSDSGSSKCVKLDSVKLGIKRSMISRDSYKVIKDLQIGGFETYLVGGCVRDLLLNKVPKDFDVITAAKLETIKKKFRRAIIVGKRFPVCRVTLKNSVVEVTSFGTVDKRSKRKKDLLTQMPACCNENDLTRWNDCMRRDFTVNSLLYDPFDNTVFDYINAMTDLKSKKLRTIIPATRSFKEDQARILRGLRLAARLNLSISKETEAAIHDLSPSVPNISKARLIMEINYMLSYGAAEASLLLLKKFKILEILLPFQAAYLSERLDGRIDHRCILLVKLLSCLDQLFTCDRPCHCSLWVALLSFHMALFTDPQPAEVVLAFASLLYQGKWEKSITFARQHAPQARIYVPEIYVDSVPLSDDEIADRVTLLAEQAKNSARFLTSKDCLNKALARFPESPSSDFIFISRNMREQAEKAFKALADVRRVEAGTVCMRIDYTKLGEGNIAEMRVLGQIIIDALTSNATGKREPTKLEKVDEKDGPEQLLKALGQMRDAPRDPRKDEPKPTTENKRNSSSNNKLLLNSTPKARIIRDDGIATEVTLSRDSVKEGPEQLFEVLERMQDAPTDSIKDEIKPKTENKPNSSSSYNLLLKDTPNVTEVTSSRYVNDGPEQLLEVLGQMGNAPTDPREDEPKPKKARIIRDDGIVTEVTLSSVMNPGTHSQKMGSCKVEKDKHVKTAIRKKVSSLYSLFK